MTVEMEFSIGNADYELEAEGDIEEGDSGHSDAPDYPATFIPDEKLEVRPIGLKDFSQDDLHFNWDMLWFEQPFVVDKVSEYIRKWDEGCFEKLMDILADGLPTTFTDQFEEGISEIDLLKRSLLQLSNESPSLFVDYTVGAFLAKIKDYYFPMGGKKLEEKTIKLMDEKAMSAFEEPEDDDSDSFY